MIWLAAIPAFWAAVIVHWCVANHRIHRIPAPAPPRPPSNPCTWCKPVPEGTESDCICPGKCGHVRCIGYNTSLSVLTLEDVRWLRQQKIRGHE